MKKYILLAFLLPLMIQVYATRIESGENVTISEPVNEDLYLAGVNVIINARVHGDLIVAGGTIILNDTVTNDILITGGTLTFNGYVGDDIRCAGGTIHLAKNVAGDVVIAGGRMDMTRDVTIGGKLLIACGDITINGVVLGGMRSGFGNLILNGTVEKELDCRGGEIEINGTINGPSVLAARKIKFGPGAKINNDVRYWSEEESSDFSQVVSNGKATFDPSLKINTADWRYFGLSSFLFFIWIAGSALIIILLIQYLFGTLFKKAAETVLLDTLKSIGFGFLFLIATPVAIVVAFITLIGIPVGLIALFIYLLLLAFSTSIISVVAANWINNVYYASRWKMGHLVLTAFGIFIILKLAFLTPFVGPLIMIIVMCLAFGAILLNIKWKKSKQAAMP